MEFNKLYRRSANQSVCNQGIVEEIIPQDFQHISHDFQNDIFSQEIKFEVDELIHDILLAESFLYSEQCGELQGFHEFHDPVAFCMELYFSKVSNAPVLGRISVYSCKYWLLIHFLLQKSLFSCMFSFTHKEKDHVVSKMITFLHWKFYFT